MRRALIFAMTASGLGAITTRANEVGSRPNVVVIVADDQGWGDFSLHGNKNLSTPHLDALARDGAQFEHFFVCPVCAPTRAEFFTGRYHPRSGVRGVSIGQERMDTDETTIADVFRSAGYRTAAFGKWHNGTQYPYHPNGRGFQEFYGFCSGHWGNYFDPMLEHNGRFVRGEGYLTNDLTSHAIQFIRASDDRPFFLFVPFNTPHSPMQVPDRWWRGFANKPLVMRHRYEDKEDTSHTRAALAMCENIDWNVGRILQALVKQQISENTIVVYFSDNGPNGFRWNGDLRGRKGSTDEGGVRSPLFVRWPGFIDAGTSVTPISGAIDIVPTLAELAGVKWNGSMPVDGVSFAAILRGNRDAGEALKNRRIFSHWSGATSVRTDQFRLDHDGRLYDMKLDPGQWRDISMKNPQETSALVSAIEEWKADVFRDQPEDKRPFLIGHSDFRFTQLPARDGVGHGGIQRSSRHPNCSYFTNWKHADDRVTWDVEVVEPGDYIVEAFYTCRDSDTGSSIDLSLNGETISATVDRAHDPPLVGAENDRVQRTESYVKDFRPMRLGTMQLSKGRGELSLRATQVAGEFVMDFRLLLFTKVD